MIIIVSFTKGGSFLSPLILKLPKGIRAVERVGLMFAEVHLKSVCNNRD